MKKPVVPRVSRALFEAARRVATGRARPGDEAAVRRVKDLAGCRVVTAARCVMVRWFWHEESPR